ncbi:MAG: beta-glucuronidase [Actinomycetaceae bacterium]|nr:beta-glucuronidase [Actinomycetaceae bacterium]MDU0969895.1 beta-glucuronidase [Actinomycetaceae bacterium]
MLSVRPSVSRTVHTLDGIWDFRVDSDGAGMTDRWFAGPLADARPMPVPASYNEITTDLDIYNHVGLAWYQRDVLAPAIGADERLILRFGSVTHQGRVWVGDTEVAYHEGGYLPFEADITDLVTPGETFRVTVAVDNELRWDTIPPGYTETDAAGVKHRNYFFDFFSYAGIHRSVVLYTRPTHAVTDVTVTTALDGTVTWDVVAEGAEDVSVRILDEAGAEVASGSGATGSASIPNPTLWKPGAGYLYTLEIHADQDVYPQPFGVRTVEAKDSQLLINGEPFYFRGYGRHEDNIVRGKGHDTVLMVHDFEVMRWQGANSFRTSHYPYAEEVLDYADRMGFVVIDETAAVGLNLSMWPGELGDVPGRKTFSETTINEATQATHAAHIRELIARDKNHPCVAIWSIANEPESETDASRAYFAPLAQVARETDPTRPVGYVNVAMATPDIEKCVDLFDVVMLNRYNGWYVQTGNLALAEQELRKEIEGWIALAPGKPIIFTEYGPDTMIGLRDFQRRPWSEEYQEDMLGMFHRVFDSYPEVVGEQMWNFADFRTIPGILRVGGNRKGMFTRDRLPKSAAYVVRERWLAMRDRLGF